MNSIFAKRRARLLAMKAMRDNYVPGEKLVTCPSCGQDSERRLVAQSLSVCPKCGYHFPIGAYYRLSTILDPGSFRELHPRLSAGTRWPFPATGKSSSPPRKKQVSPRPSSPPPAPSAGSGVWWACWTAGFSWVP